MSTVIDRLDLLNDTDLIRMALAVETTLTGPHHSRMLKDLRSARIAFERAISGPNEDEQQSMDGKGHSVTHLRGVLRDLPLHLLAADTREVLVEIA